MSLICKLLVRGQTVPEMLEAIVYGRLQATVCLSHLHWMCLITCEQEVHRQEIC